MENSMKNVHTLTDSLALLARLLLGQIFLIAGLSKIGAYAAMEAYMESKGVPAGLLPLVIALEAGAGLALTVGLYARGTALLLALFALITAFIFHTPLSDQIQQILFMKNLSIAGGLLMVVAFGPGAWNLDCLWRREART